MNEKILATGKYLKFLERDGYEIIERVNSTGVVLVIAVTDDGRIVLIDQYRKALDKRIVELPAGLVEDEPFEAAARRELLEETGYEATGSFKLVGIWPTSGGMTNEVVHAYLARGLKKVAEGGGDATEDINVHIVELAGVDAWLEKMVGKDFLVDPKIYAALYLAIL